MSALVQALVLASVPDLDAAGIVNDIDRRPARHGPTDGGPALRASAISFPWFYTHNLESARISLAN
jgi:hypothetical protein